MLLSHRHAWRVILGAAAGAEAYRRDNPNATVKFLVTGHFALETHVEEIAIAIQRFLAKNAA